MADFEATVIKLGERAFVGLGRVDVPLGTSAGGEAGLGVATTGADCGIKTSETAWPATVR
jgi:hypothetical protein